MKKSDAWRIGISSGVIASLIIIFVISPLLDLLWGLLLTTGTTALSGILDSIYRSAALGHRNDVSFILLMFILGAASVSIVTFSITVRLSKINKSGKTNKSGKRASILSINEKTKKIFNYTTDISGVITILSISFIIVTSFFTLQLHTSFQQRLAVLRPAISQETYIRFLADWANMKNQNDYSQIQEAMQREADGKSVILPELLLD